MQREIARERQRQKEIKWIGACVLWALRQLQVCLANYTQRDASKKQVHTLLTSKDKG